MHLEKLPSILYKFESALPNILGNFSEFVPTGHKPACTRTVYLCNL